MNKYKYFISYTYKEKALGYGNIILNLKFDKVSTDEIEKLKFLIKLDLEIDDIDNIVILSIIPLPILHHNHKSK